MPDRPARVKGNTKNRPAYVWLTDENFGCPLNYARMISVESEITPIMIGDPATEKKGVSGLLRTVELPVEWVSQRHDLQEVLRSQN